MWELSTVHYIGVVWFHSSRDGLLWYSVWFLIIMLSQYLTFSLSVLAATKQLWMVQSLCLSVCLGHLCHYVPVIVSSWNFITIDKSDVYALRQGQRSKVKVTEVMTPLSRFRTVTPVWIHIWQWNDAHSLIMLRRGALLYLQVICQISRSHSSKRRRFWSKLGVSGL